MLSILQETEQNSEVCNSNVGFLEVVLSLPWVSVSKQLTWATDERQ